MALTLDQILSAPQDPALLRAHLDKLGLLPSPVPQPVTPVAPMTPPAATAAPSAVKPMTPPSSAPQPYSPGDPLKPFVAPTSPAMNVSGVRPMVPPTATPNAPAAPDLGTGVGASPDTGAGVVKPMTLPKLTGAEEMHLPTSSPGVEAGSPEFWRNKIEQDEWKKANPWGSADNHPGLLGKIGHYAGAVGQIAGGILNPRVVAGIPGTRLYNQAQEANDVAQLGTAENRQSETALRAAEAANLQSEVKEREGKNAEELVRGPDGSVSGWKDKTGIHGLDDPSTPQTIKDLAAGEVGKPRYETDKVNGNIVKITPGTNGDPDKTEVVYKGQPGIKTETRSVLGDDNKAHDKVFDITPGSPNFGKPLADLGRSKEDKQVSVTQELAKMKAGEEPVIGFDKNGVQRLVPKSQADEMGLTHVIKSTPKDRADAETNTGTLNDMGVKVRNALNSSKALDQGIIQKQLIATALRGAPDDLTTRFAISKMSEQSKEYVTDIFSLREAALALPKQTTGGSRVSEPQAKALWNSVPGSSGDSKYAEKQLRKFDQNLDRLWKKVPLVEGNEPERAFANQPSGGGEVPAGKTTVYDPQGAPHYVNSDKVEAFLKDPKYKGWSQNGPK